MITNDGESSPISKGKSKRSLSHHSSYYSNGLDFNEVSGFSSIHRAQTRNYFRRIKVHHQNKNRMVICYQKTQEVSKYIFYLVSNIINIFNIINYIAQSYLDKSTNKDIIAFNNTLSIFDLSFSLYFLAEYCLIKLLRKEQCNLRVIFSIESLIDLITIIPSIITYFFNTYQAKPILQIFKVFRILRLYKSIKTLQYDTSFENGLLHLNHITLQVILIVITFMCLFFIASGVVFNLQILLPDSFNIPDMSFGDCVYYIIITSTTLGYGDIVPTHIVSRMLIIVLILSNISLVSYELTRLIQLFQLFANYSKYSIKKHIICLVNKTIPLAVILKEVKKDFRNQSVILISKDHESVPSTEYPYEKVYVINTETIDLDVLERANAKDARSIFIFGNTVFDSFERSEKVNEFTVLKINQLYNSIPIYAQSLYNDKSFLNNVKTKKDEIFSFLVDNNSSGTHDDTIQKIVPIFKIKSLIISKALFNPGFATFAQNLLFNDTAIPNDLYGYDPPMQAYFLGCENTIKIVEMPHCFIRQEFHEVMRQIYSKSIRDFITKVTVDDQRDGNRPILLIGVVDTSNKNLISIFPKNFIFTRKSLGIFISYDHNNYIEKILNSFPHHFKPSIKQNNNQLNLKHKNNNESEDKDQLDDDDGDDDDNDDEEDDDDFKKKNRKNEDNTSQLSKVKLKRVCTSRRNGFLEDTKKSAKTTNFYKKKSFDNQLQVTTSLNINDETENDDIPHELSGNNRNKEEEEMIRQSKLLINNDNNHTNIIHELNKIVSSRIRKDSFDFEDEEEDEYMISNYIFINEDGHTHKQNGQLTEEGLLDNETKKYYKNLQSHTIDKSSNYGLMKYSSNAIIYDHGLNTKLQIIKERSPIKKISSPKKVAIKQSKTVFFDTNDKQKEKLKTNFNDYIIRADKDKKRSIKASIKAIDTYMRQPKKDPTVVNQEFYIEKKNQMITGKNELHDFSTKKNLLFLENFNNENLDKVQSELSNLAQRRYVKNELVDSEFVVDNRIFDVAKDNIAEILADHVLFVGYQDGLSKMIKMVKLHYPYRDVCVMTHYLFDDKIIMKYLKEFKGLYFLKGEIDNPIHLINAGIAKAAYVVFLIENIDNKKNEDMVKILAFRAIDYFFQSKLLLELWDHSSVSLLGYKPLSKSISLMNNPYNHPLYMAGQLLYLDQLNRVVCMSHKNKLKVEAWNALLNIGYKVNSSSTGDTIRLQNETNGFPVLLSIDLPEEYIGKEFYDVFTDMICQKNPIMILGIYIHNPLEYVKLRSEGRVKLNSKIKRSQTNELNILTSHKKKLINMNAFNQNEQDCIANLKTLKDMSYNDKIITDYVDLRRPFHPIFITNPPPWLIMSKNIQLFVLYYNDTSKCGADLSSFQRKYIRCRDNKNQKVVFGTTLFHQNRVVLNERQDNFYNTINVLKDKIQQKYTDAFKVIEIEATRQKKQFGTMQEKDHTKITNHL